MKNSEIQPAQIFQEDGTVDNTVAIEVFQCDIQNGVSRIINYDRNTEVSDSTYVPVIKVVGTDSGIRHSFEVSIDQFASGDDKRLVNYRNYYFVALAYAYNEFAPFDPEHADSTQDVSYLESSKGAGGSVIKVVAAMPNPANGDMGTVINSDYGSGVIIKRIEGTGNGGNSIQLSDSSELEAITGVRHIDSPSRIIHQAINPTYKAGQGPVDIKVIDPLKVKPHDWELYITGATNSDAVKGLDSSRSSWKLVNVTTGEVIYSEKADGLASVNEQILENYGISVDVSQVGRPGDDQVNGNGLITSGVTFKDQGLPWLSGVQDGESSDLRNWIRSGNNTVADDTICVFDDGPRFDTVGQFYEQLLSNNTLTRGTWAPYALANAQDGAPAIRCGIGVARPNTSIGLGRLNSVDIIFTDDKSKWTRSLVLEMQQDPAFAEGGAVKFEPRLHPGWNGDLDDSGRPVYSTSGADSGMSMFPGYAINQETGERLNIIFGEDSWLKTHGGNDMIWNPSTVALLASLSGIDPVYGGKHYVYVLSSRYDSCRSFIADYNLPGVLAKKRAFENHMMYVGVPLRNQAIPYKSLADGLIPTETRIRIRVIRPYAQYATNFNKPATDSAQMNAGYPLYSFSTKDLAPMPLADNPSADRDALLNRIHAVPNPYYGYTGYEQNRLDSRVRIINLPKKATISIYSLDGALIRQLQKDNANTSFIDWDIRNTKGLPIASGMYLIHINADGIGEKVLRWFGAMRPIDITSF